MKTNLVDNGIPCKSGVVHYDMNLAIAKFSGFPNQLVDIFAIEQVAGYGDGAPPTRIDLVGDGLGLDGIDVGHDHLGTFVGEKPGTFCPDPLRRPCDDCDLAGQEPPGIIQVASNLVHSVGHVCSIKTQASDYSYDDRE